MIEVSHLTKRFWDIVAVDDASFHARNGAITGLLGHNGAGKSLPPLPVKPIGQTSQ